MKSNYTCSKSKTALLFFTLSSVFVLFSLCANAQSWVWQQNMGGAGTEKITDMVADASGNTYVCGTYTGAFSIGSFNIAAPPGSNSTGAFVAKINSGGTAQWVHTPAYGATVYLNPTTITRDATGNIYYGGINQSAGNSVTFATGNASTVVTNNSSTDGFIVKLNSSGVAQWAMGMGYSGAAGVNNMALHSDPYTTYLFFGVSAATNSTAQPQFQNFNYHAPGSTSNVSMGNASATGFQESWYGRIDVAAGVMNGFYRLGAGNNATGQEWIESIRTNSNNGDVFMAITLKNATTLEYNGGTQSINATTVESGKIIKLNANLVYQAQTAAIGSQSFTNKMKRMTMYGNSSLAFLIDVQTGSNNPSVSIGGYDLSFGSSWLNSVLTSAGSTKNFSGKGLAFDASGNLYATVGGNANATFNWDFIPAYSAAAATGSMQTNPGLMLLKINPATGTWSDFSYIRESAANNFSQGGNLQSGALATAGATVFMGGSYGNAITAPGLTTITSAGQSNAYLMKFGCEPGFTTQPANKTICGAQTISLPAAASGTGNTYQWQKNGTNINGATNDTLTIANATISDTGTYTLIATNSCGSATSNTAIINYADQPIITLQPVADTACFGTVVTLTVAATGNVTGYDWLMNGGLLGTTSVYSGVKTTTLTISGINASRLGPYSVNVNGSVQCPSVSSNIVTFKMATAPGITTDPTDKTLCEGANATLVSGAASGSPVNYQWLYNLVPISGANSASYSKVVSTSDAGFYYLRASNLCGSDTSNQAIINVTPIPVIDTAPVSQNLCAGTPATVYVTDNAGFSYIFNYAWYRNNTLVNSGTSPSHYINGTAGSAGSYFVRVSNSCGADTALFNVAVNTATAITTQPTSLSLCTGSPATFTVAATGGNLSYQWRKNGNPIAAATNASYNIPSVAITDSGTYTVVVTGSCGTTTSTGAILTTATAATISQQPAGATLCSGDTIRLSVSGAAGNNTMYQWRKGSNNIAYTTPTATIPNAQVADAGLYSVVITGSCGTTTSQSANIVIRQTSAITTQPADVSVCVGQPISLQAVATGTNLTYQWQKNNLDINGATQFNYSIPSAALSDTGTYALFINGTCGYALSNGAIVRINPPTAITTQPTAQTACAGSPATFTIAATGAGLSYQWRQGSQNIPGASANSYSIPTAAAGNAGSYSVVVTGACGSTTSNAVPLTVNAATAISSGPISQSACTGGAVSLSVSATGSNLGYQWKKNGSNIAGANTAAYNIVSAALADSGTYTVVVTGACGTVTSTAAALSVVATASISAQPAGDTICIGDTLRLSVTGTAGTNTTYQWRNNNSVIAFNTPAIVIPNAQIANAGEYNVVITGGCGTVSSMNATVAINSLTNIVTEPASQAVCVGGAATLSIFATGTGLSYQWKLDGNDIAGETGSDITLGNILSTQLGIYTVEVSGACGTQTSAPAVLSAASPVSIPAQPAASNTSVCPGESITLSATTAGDVTMLQWKQDGANIFDANSNQYTFTPAAPGTFSYTLFVSGSCSSVLSDSVTITVHALPQPTVIQNGTDLSTQFFATYQWQLSGADINAATAQNYTAPSNGNYNVVVTDAHGCSASSPVVNVTGVGINTAFESGISIYPNPSASLLNIVLGSNGMATLLVQSADGKTVAAIQTSDNKTVLDVSNYAQGVYLMNITQNKNQAHIRFVKQ